MSGKKPEVRKEEVKKEEKTKKPPKCK